MNLLTLIAVFVGGGAGSVVRFAISYWIQTMNTTMLPVATILANFLSTAILGVLFFKLSDSMPSHLAVMLTIGFCGGFSTFSTFSLETFQLMRAGQMLFAILNVVVSLLLCLTVLFVLYKTLK